MAYKPSTSRSSLDHKRQTYNDPVISFALMGVALFAAVSGAIFISLPLSPLASYAAGATLATFLLCGYDKGIAGGTRTRVPERVFYLLALLGGSLGLLLGMKFFRHKTQKANFQFFLAIVLAFQICIYFYVVRSGIMDGATGAFSL